MTSAEFRQIFLDFFRSKGHEIIPSASLIPENDPTVLFTTAGMQPLVPYLSGALHPKGVRLADAQKCLRTDDIDEVGDNRHLTFFEMLGNWSLGDYFKREAIDWSFEFLTSSTWLNINPKRLYISVFKGERNTPRDDESIDIWQAQFEMKGIAAQVGERIFLYSKKENWWHGPTMKGLCGPDTEIFYKTDREHNQTYGVQCHPNCGCGRFVEIWNNVFIQFERKEENGPCIPLPLKNVDTGMGLERMVAVLNNVDTVFDIPEFRVILRGIEQACDKRYGEDTTDDRSFRIIADHTRAATFVIGDPHGVIPSNVGQGYIIRRLLRRAIREGRRLGIHEPFLAKLAAIIIGEYGVHYAELETHRQYIIDELKKEEMKFSQTLEKGIKEFKKMSSRGDITGEQAFVLFSTYGFPLELTQELITECGKTLDVNAFQKEFTKHQELSRSASAGMFKGGLADISPETTRLHTATHLLHKALKIVLGDHVQQKGSNITQERLRFDFSHPKKMTTEEIGYVEDIVNDAIQEDYPVHFEEMSLEDAKKICAIGYFEDKYAKLNGKIKVYIIGDDTRGIYSKEICGGPHVTHTGELGHFKILKEEAISAGIRRIKATVTGSCT